MDHFNHKQIYCIQSLLSFFVCLIQLRTNHCPILQSDHPFKSKRTTYITFSNTFNIRFTSILIEKCLYHRWRCSLFSHLFKLKLTRLENKNFKTMIPFWFFDVLITLLVFFALVSAGQEYCYHAIRSQSSSFLFKQFSSKTRQISFQFYRFSFSAQCRKER